jgi:hypothetical protein
MRTQPRYIIKSANTGRYFGGYTQVRALQSWRKHARGALVFPKIEDARFWADRAALAKHAPEIVELAPTHEWGIQQFTRGYGWETVNTESSEAGAIRSVSEYRENQGALFRAVLVKAKP